jgi:hypothetical protein
MAPVCTKVALTVKRSSKRCCVAGMTLLSSGRVESAFYD